MNEQEMVTEFCIAAGDPCDSYHDWAELRKKLLREECEEVCDAIDGGNVLEITKELADLLYVTYGTAIKPGINLHEAYRLVHESNMSKLVDRKPLVRADGKILKGPNYRAPDMRSAVK
jgi:predicted HAD superfamily Cof-like phosphohydrolase